MDKIVKQTLQQLDRLEQNLKQCEHRLNRIGRAHTPVYFGVPTQARTHFNGLYNTLAHMRWMLGEDVLPPEG